MITSEEQNHYKKNGYLIIKNFYSLKEILLLHCEIKEIINLICKKNGVPFKEYPTHETNEHNFDEYLMALAKHNRSAVGLVYDAVKQLPAFINLSSCSKHKELYQLLTSSKVVGYAGSGNGVRIDLPKEDKFLYSWHQDFPYQLRSLDGGVFWTPLCTINQENGPLEIAVGSHKNGLFKLYYDKSKEQLKGYQLRIQNVENILASYKKNTVELNPGDLLIFDFRLLHKSGYNFSPKARWSMQFRFFNFEDEWGIKNNWVGGYASGKSIEDIIPNLFDKDY